MFSQSRRNLARWFTWSMGGILIVFAQLIYYIETRDQLWALDNALYDRTSALASTVELNTRKGQSKIAFENLLMLRSNSGLGSELIYVRWYNQERKIVQFIGQSPTEKNRIKLGFKTLKSANIQVRQLTIPVVENEILIGYLQVATSLKPFQDTTQKLRLFLTVGVPITWGIIGLTGWLLGGMAMQPIRQSYEAQSRFTADASHELRAPLAAILSNAQVGLLAPGCDEVPRQRLEKIVTLTKSMTVLIGHLLLLARHEGKLNPEFLQTVNLTLLLTDLATFYQDLALDKNLTFLTQLPQQSILVHAEPELLRQAIENLLNNAFKYTNSGGTISLKLIYESRWVMISVTDTGMGIPPQDLPHIFDRFYRVDQARTRKTGGFGLGLAIVKQIVEAHQGSIQVNSTLGVGSTFTLELPREKPGFSKKPGF
ncbi:HAMP domain-containing sensor histidine kinase [Limnoraphis robusta Tam1]|uniref:sensor histidine kinase n=1 Tax=Limnoraphis robusta TaxID=1118279 RepID=UPI002B21A5F1|nr:HAMP domain-containing sensor histidine kinase [Limnoraphis robusta]MEA5540932.1 HAMP domain-containing sensor histidine kinase [Limnoraphis robusta Tam1]